MSALILLALAVFALPLTGCGDDEGDDDTTEEEQETREPSVESESDLTMALPNTAGQEYVVFTYAGENLPYHTVLISATPILLDYPSSRSRARSRSRPRPAPSPPNPGATTMSTTS